MRTLLILFTMMTCTMAQDKGIPYKKEALLGVWAYVETYTQFSDGRREPQFGQHPVGRFVIMPNGQYSHIIMDPGLPKIKAGRFKELTIEEAERISEGVLAHFGTWTADEKAGTFTVTIEKSSFPNFDNVQQIRTIRLLTRDTLSYVNNLSVAAPGAIVVAVLRRVQ